MKATTRSLSKIAEDAFAFILQSAFTQERIDRINPNTEITIKSTMLLKNALVLALLLAAAVEADAGHTVRGERHDDNNTRERRMKSSKKRQNEVELLLGLAVEVNQAPEARSLVASPSSIDSEPLVARPTPLKSGVLAIFGDRPRPILTSARTANPPRPLCPSAPSAPTRPVGLVLSTTSISSPPILQPPQAFLLAGVASIEGAM